jgi:hypothetical protein
MKTSYIIKCALIGITLPLFAGCVTRTVVYRDRPVVVDQAPAPPPPQAEVITVAPGPRDVWYWAPGAWEWRRGHWIWTRGHWVARPRPGAVWVGAHWGWSGSQRIWVEGTWR